MPITEKVTPEDFQKLEFRHKPEHFHPTLQHYMGTYCIKLILQKHYKWLLIKIKI